VEGSISPPDGSPILSNDQPVGWATSVRYSWHAAKVIGMAWVTPALAAKGTRLTLRSEAIDYPASVVDAMFYDPTGERLHQ
jgi:glycine cleavage system aminomethyltransferase T